MKKIFKIVKVFLFIYYVFNLEYRVELFMWVLLFFLFFIMMGIWIEVIIKGEFLLDKL